MTSEPTGERGAQGKWGEGGPGTGPWGRGEHQEGRRAEGSGPVGASSGSVWRGAWRDRL